MLAAAAVQPLQAFLIVGTFKIKGGLGALGICESKYGSQGLFTGAADVIVSGYYVAARRCIIGRRVLLLHVCKHIAPASHLRAH